MDDEDLKLISGDLKNFRIYAWLGLAVAGLNSITMLVYPETANRETVVSTILMLVFGLVGFKVGGKPLRNTRDLKCRLALAAITLIGFWVLLQLRLIH